MAFEMAHQRKQVQMVSSGIPSQAWLTQVIMFCLVGWVRLPAASKGGAVASTAPTDHEHDP